VARQVCVDTGEHCRCLARRAPGATRIGLESGLLSTWHWHALKALGLPVVCLDARHVKAALSLRLNKTDANDAEGLAQIVRTGWYRQVQVKSLDSHLIRTLLAARAGLVATHRDVANQVRGALKTFGLVLGKVAAGTFEARVRQLIAGNPLLVEVIEALLKVWRTTGEQLVTLHRRVLRLTQTDETCRRLMTVPGVGAVTAAAFLATVDDPERFRRSSSVGAYFGLTPRRCQSGDIDYTGRISKRGDGAHAQLPVRSRQRAADTGVYVVDVEGVGHASGQAERRHQSEGRARPQAGGHLHRLWCDGTSFRWSTQKQQMMG
jgi:transposase